MPTQENKESTSKVSRRFKICTLNSFASQTNSLRNANNVITLHQIFFFFKSGNT